MIELAHRHGRPVLVDPKGTDWGRYQQATCVTPNTAELEALVGQGLETDETKLIDAARTVRARFGLERLLVTRGAQGMCLVGPDDSVTLILSQAREVFDVLRWWCSPTDASICCIPATSACCTRPGAWATA